MTLFSDNLNKFYQLQKKSKKVLPSAGLEPVVPDKVPLRAEITTFRTVV